MKDYKTTAIVLATILSLSAFTGCSQITNDDSVNDDLAESASVLEDANMADAETIDESSFSVESGSEDVESVSDGVSNTDLTGVEVSDVSTQDAQTVTSVSTSSDSSVASSDVPVGGSVSSSTVLVQTISLSKSSVTVEVGESDMPIVTMSPSNASDKSEVWDSSNPQIATVDSKGNITGVSEGTCTVTVKAKANTSVSAQISVTVTAKAETTQSQSNDSSSDEITEPTYIEGILIVNKTYGLPKDYDPYDGGLSPEVQEAFDRMEQDARAEGLNLYISSGFRSYEYQVGLYERYASSDGYANADKYSARAGYSEHQSGLCFDLNTIDDSFADTAEGKWVAENCYKYGFIIRFPKGKEDITGYQYEPWHLRYLGVFIATDVYNSGLCLEEYLGVTSKYAD